MRANLLPMPLPRSVFAHQLLAKLLSRVSTLPFVHNFLLNAFLHSRTAHRENVVAPATGRPPCPLQVHLLARAGYVAFAIDMFGAGQLVFGEAKTEAMQ